MLVLADFDGTLAPIRPRPDQARLSPRFRALLRQLARRDGLILGVVSGRSITTLRRLIRVPGLVYAGNHGLELEGRGFRFVLPAAERSAPALRQIARQLRRALRDVPGAIVESKELSLSVHSRAVSPALARVFHRRLRDILGPWARRGQVQLTRGHGVVEIRPPVAWHKGSAVEWLRRRLKVPGTRVVYFGDDRTDEDAFRAVNRIGGMSVRVGPGPSAAAWRLRGPADVERLLAKLRALPWNNK